MDNQRWAVYLGRQGKSRRALLAYSIPNLFSTISAFG